MSKDKTIIKKKRIGKKQKQFLEAFALTMGNVSAACKKINISRQTFYDWKEQYYGFADKCEEVEEGNLDFAESKLLLNIKEGKEVSTIFFLKTKGKNRGYIEKQEIETRIVDKFADKSDEELEAIVNGSNE